MEYLLFYSILSCFSLGRGEFGSGSHWGRFNLAQVAERYSNQKTSFGLLWMVAVCRPQAIVQEIVLPGRDISITLLVLPCRGRVYVALNFYSFFTN
jgi:hypothetical protein